MAEYIAPDVRAAAKRVNDAAASVVYIYSERSLELRLASSPTSAGPAKSFDIDAAQSALADFTTAIDVFLDAAHLPRPAAKTSRSRLRRLARSLTAIVPTVAAARHGGDGGG